MNLGGLDDSSIAHRKKEEDVGFWLARNGGMEKKRKRL